MDRPGLLKLPVPVDAGGSVDVKMWDKPSYMGKFPPVPGGTDGTG